MKMTFFERIGYFWRKQQFNREKQKTLLRDMSELLGYGIPLSTAVNKVLPEIYEEEIYQTVLDQIAIGLRSGKGISACLKYWYDEFTVSIVRAGEKGGDLAEAMKKADEVFGQRRGAMKLFFATMTYPFFVFFAAMLMTILFHDKVFTLFLTIKPESYWPGIAQFFYGFSAFVTHAWFWVLLLLLVLAVAFNQVLRRYTGSLRHQFDRWPIFNVYREINASIFMEIMGQLMTSGLSFKQSLQVVRENVSPYLQYQCNKMLAKLKVGHENISKVLDVGLINHGDIVRLSVLATVGKVEHQLKEISSHSHAAALRRIQRNARLGAGLFFAVSAIILIVAFVSVYLTGLTISGA